MECQNYAVVDGGSPKLMTVRLEDRLTVGTINVGPKMESIGR